MKTIFEALSGNSYPGRGIVLGEDASARYALAAYFIMGRSVNSRNRVFLSTEDGIRTQCADPSKMTDPSLIIYHPVRWTESGLIVANGDQSDTLRDALSVGGSFREALMTREYEPDAPNFTPRISGLLKFGGGAAEYELSILKRGGDGGTLRRFWSYGCAPGVGRYITTYQRDGQPLPPFEGAPRPVALEGDIDEFASRLWEALNKDNRVALYVRFTDLTTGQAKERSINKIIDNGQWTMDNEAPGKPKCCYESVARRVLGAAECP